MNPETNAIISQPFIDDVLLAVMYSFCPLNVERRDSTSTELISTSYGVCITAMSLMHVISITFPNELFYRNERQVYIIRRHVTASKEPSIWTISIEYIEGIEQTASNVQKELLKARFAVVDPKIPFPRPSGRCLTNALLAQVRVVNGEGSALDRHF